MSSDNRSFEQIRDTFFVNPRTGDAGVLPHGAYYLAEELLGTETPGKGVFSSLVPGSNPELEAYLNSLTADMRGARRFDHKSMAQLHPTDNIPATLGHWASLLRNNNTIIGDVSPVESRYERESVDWMILHIAGWDVETGSGSLVNGGTSANLAALFVAREALTEQGWDGMSKVSILANEMAHYSIKKAAGILAPNGIIEVVNIPFLGNSLVMDTDALAKQVQEEKEKGRRIMAIVGIAGETETGLIEDLDRVADIARSNEIYFHIDAAYGGPFRLSRVGSKFGALSLADSITCDPHKYMWVPYAAGAVLFRDASLHNMIAKLNTDGTE